MNTYGLPAIQKYVSGGEINAIYQALFDRDVDPGGRDYYGPGGAGDLSKVSYEDAVGVIARGAINDDLGKATPEVIQRAIDDFNKLLDKGYYSEAAAFATNAGVDPEVTANYVNETRGLSGPNIIVGSQVQELANEYNTKIDNTDFRRQLDAAYDSILNRPSDAEGFDFYVNQRGFFNDGTLSEEEIAEIRRNAQPEIQINELFDQYFNRAPTAEEMAKYQPLYKSDNTIDATERQAILDDLGYQAPKGDTVTGGASSDSPSTDNQDTYYLTGGATLPGPGEYSGVPQYTRQQASGLTFAPIRRGLGQLRGPAYMPGLVAGSDAFGGAGMTQEQIREGALPYYQSIEAGTPGDEAIRNYINEQMVPFGISPAEAAASLNLPLGAIQEQYNVAQPRGMFSTASPGQPVIPKDFVMQTGAYTTPVIPTTPGRSGGVVKDNKIIKMAEGGETTLNQAMQKLTAKEAGSKFDISKEMDEQGDLVRGFSRPVYDDYGKITGYKFEPYQQAVSPAMTEQERRQFIVRQGLTGVSPTMGGLPDIVAREALMRNRPRYYSYAEGGLASAAQNLASRGRYGDSVLVHMAPEELSGLRALARAQGNDLTINPRTGLPEAFSLKKLFKAASFVLPFIPIPGLFGMSSLLTRSILSGVAAGASAKGGFDLKQALGGGLRAYAMGSLGEKLGGGPATPGGPTTTPTTVPDAAAVNPMAAPTVTTPSGDISLASSYTGAGATPVGPQSLSADLTGPLKVGGSYTDVAAAPISRVDAGFANVGDPGTIVKPGMAPMTSSVPVTGGTLPPGADTVPGRMSSVITPEGQGYGQPLTKGTEIAMAGLGGLSIEEGAREQRNYELQAAAARREEEERERRFEELARRTLGRVQAKEGGIIKLAKGGMTYMEAGGTTGPTGEPRDVTGTGDGMSDSVPASIEGVQEARLADGEFVIPADVVADIGNGSSDAGSKKLYDMMDRIRKARHGTTKQPPEIKAERLMPA